MRVGHGRVAKYVLTSLTAFLSIIRHRQTTKSLLPANDADGRTIECLHLPTPSTPAILHNSQSVGSRSFGHSSLIFLSAPLILSDWIVVGILVRQV